MSLVSLEKYLYQSQKKHAAAEQPQPSPAPSLGGYVELSMRVLSAIRRSVFTGEALSDLSEELEAIRKELNGAAGGEAASQSAGRVEALLATFQSRLREAQEERAADFKKVLDILNETFTHLSAGTEQSGVRLKQMEVNLSRAAKIDDLASLRGQLLKMLDYVRQESKLSQEAQPTLETLGQQIRQAHASTSRFRVQLPNRLEALELLKEKLAARTVPDNLHLALFAADSLRALRARHGDEIGANILDELGRKQIQALSPEGKVFCWSPTSILLMWDHRDPFTAPGDLPHHLKSPFEQRAFVGTRVATFSVAVRSLVMPATGAIEEISASLDRFWKGGPGC